MNLQGQAESPKGHHHAPEPLFTRALLLQALRQAFVKFHPLKLAKNPVMFLVAVSSAFATILYGVHIAQGAGWQPIIAQILLWLWATVLFANLAEALAEGRGKARADSLRQTRSAQGAKLLDDPEERAYTVVPPDELHVDDVVLVEAGDIIPGDGEVIEGIATVNESAITGESAPVIRESGGDRSAVTGGTMVISDWIKVRITAERGETFLDRMIRMVEGAARQKTPNEIALDILLAGLSLIFLVAVFTLACFAAYSGTTVAPVYLVALLVTLIPTTIGGLLSAIGIAGMDRLIRFNIVAKSGRAVEAAGDIDTILLDKTGTITYGNRMMESFHALRGVPELQMAEAAILASWRDETPEGKSIVQMGINRHGVTIDPGRIERFIPFSAQNRMSGVDLSDGTEIRKGARDSMLKLLNLESGPVYDELTQIVDTIARAGGTPLVVIADNRPLGVVYLKDTIKPGIRERFAQLRQMGIRTVMITGDNPLTAATIAAEAGVDDFLAEATPERKLEFIRKAQASGSLVAMCGDGSNDAPALAQADVGIAMNDGTQPAKEAANLIDLDSDPTKLIEVVLIGKQLLITRGALTTFSIANDVAKYFAIIPPLFLSLYPQLEAINIMRLGGLESAVLSAVIFNALIIVILIPLALRGVSFRSSSASALLRRHLLLFGGLGLLIPFAGIKIIEITLKTMGLVGAGG